jgi:uncharacterized protein YlzI (FlbEa/FlbD family)
MIRVIRTDGVEILLNSDLIKTIEGDKDKTTIITLTNDEKISVKTPAYDVSQKVKAFITGISEEQRGPTKQDKEYDKEKAKEKDADKEKGKDRGRDKDKFKKYKSKPRDRDSSDRGGKKYSSNRSKDSRSYRSSGNQSGNK